MKKVYIVVSGTYSDYSIEACFSDKSAAETFCDKIKAGDSLKDDARIEEHELFAEVPKPTRRFYAWIDRDGKETDRGMREQYPWEHDTTRVWPRRLSGQACAVGVSPRGYAVALKAARDALAQADAEAVAIGVHPTEQREG